MPMGVGKGVPRRNAPMALKKEAPSIGVFAAPNEGIFGTYW